MPNEVRGSSSHASFDDVDHNANVTITKISDGPIEESEIVASVFFSNGNI